MADFASQHCLGSQRFRCQPVAVVRPARDGEGGDQGIPVTVAADRERKNGGNFLFQFSRFHRCFQFPQEKVFCFFPDVLQFQQPRAGGAAAVFRLVEVRMRGDQGKVIPHHFAQDTALGVFLQQIFPCMEHQRMMGHDQFRTEFFRFLYHIPGAVQRHEDLRDLRVPAAYDGPNVVVAFRRFHGSQFVQNVFNRFHSRAHVLLPPSAT